MGTTPISQTIKFCLNPITKGTDPIALVAVVLKFQSHFHFLLFFGIFLNDTRQFLDPIQFLRLQLQSNARKTTTLLAHLLGQICHYDSEILVLSLYLFENSFMQK